MTIRFKDDKHEKFFEDCIKDANVNNGDTYRRAFFYIMGILPDTRAHIKRIWDFKNNCPQPGALYDPWQTSGTIKMCRLAFNLYNGHHHVGDTWETLKSDTTGDYTPYELFATPNAFYMIEAVKIRYPEYTNPEVVDFAELLQQGLAPAT